VSDLSRQSLVDRPVGGRSGIRPASHVHLPRDVRTELLQLGHLREVAVPPGVGLEDCHRVGGRGVATGDWMLGVVVDWTVETVLGVVRIGWTGNPRLVAGLIRERGRDKCRWIWSRVIQFIQEVRNNRNCNSRTFASLKTANCNIMQNLENFSKIKFAVARHVVSLRFQIKIQEGQSNALDLDLRC